MLAAIRIRGPVGTNVEIKDTLNFMRLQKKHTCVLLEDNAGNTGMLKKVKDFITWGEIDEETAGLLKQKGEKKFYRLHPPRGGFERKGIKAPFVNGGVLGNRKESINGLIRSMLP